MKEIKDYYEIDYGNKLIYVIGGPLIELYNETSDFLKFLANTTHQEYKNFSLKKEDFFLSSLILSISNECPLRCKYCFNKKNFYARHRRMSFDIAKKAIDLLLEKCANEKDFLIGFTGGEPMLNFSLIKKVINYCLFVEREMEKHFTFGMATNTLYLDDDVIDFLSRIEDFGIVISLDGPKDIHDSNRVFPNGEGSFDTIAPKIKRYITRWKEVGKITCARAVYTGEHRLMDILNGIFSMGFDQIFIELERKPGGNEYNEDFVQHVFEDFSEFYECFVDNLSQGKIVKYMDFIQVIKDIIRNSYRIYGCNGGLTQIAVSTSGDVYPCERLIENQRFLMGNVKIGLEASAVDYLLTQPVERKKVCNHCWIRYLCGGGCHYINDGGPSPVDQNWCEAKKIITRFAMCAVYEISRIRDRKVLTYFWM